MQQDTTRSILYVDDETNNLNSFKAAFRREYDVYTAASALEGLDIISRHDIDVIVTDQRMPAMTGIQFLQHIPENLDNIRIILTGFSDIESIIEAINTGKVYRYITKPWDKNELKVTLDNALETVHLRRNNKHLIAELQESNEHLEEKVQLRTAEIEKQRVLIAEEKEKADSLLLNILPGQVVDELKESGHFTARRHDQVSVAFADIKDFTHIAEALSSEDLVSELDHMFQAFDDIVERHRIEKIKTIGDAYMFVSGLDDEEGSDSVCRIVKAALEMQRFALAREAIRQKEGKLGFKIRIGINTGPVIAGIVGKRKFTYDIWGDTVNVAARIEQHGHLSRVNISESTYGFIRNDFSCVSRGNVHAKNKGEIAMYYIDGSE